MKVVPPVIAEVKRIREIFSVHHGVPISQEFVDFANAIGNLCDAAIALAAAAVNVPVEAQAKEESCGFVTSAITETTSETPSIIAKPASNLDGLMSTPHRITKKKSDFNSPENWEKYLDSIVNAPEPNVIVNEDGTCRPVEAQGKPDARPVIGPNTHRGEDGSVSVLGTSTGVAEPTMKAVPVENLEELILRLHAKSVASREEAIRIRQTVYVATDAESNCQIRAEVWDSVIDELSALAAAADTAEEYIAENKKLLADKERLREACRECLPLIEFYTKREVESPSNHQEFAREAEERLRRFRDAIEKASHP